MKEEGVFGAPLEVGMDVKESTEQGEMDGQVLTRPRVAILDLNSGGRQTAKVWRRN